MRILDLRRYRGVLRHRMGAEEPWTTVQGEFLMVWANNLPCERCHTAFPCLSRQDLLLDRFVGAWFRLGLCLGLRYCGLVGWCVWSGAATDMNVAPTAEQVRTLCSTDSLLLTALLSKSLQSPKPA